jgi:hypothetical protein
MKKLKKLLLLVLALTLTTISSPSFSLEPQPGDTTAIDWKQFALELTVASSGVSDSWDTLGLTVGKAIRQLLSGDQVVEPPPEEAYTEEQITELQVLDVLLMTLPLAAEFIPDGKLKSARARAVARRIRNTAKIQKLVGKQAAAASAGILGIFDLLVSTVVLILQLTVPFFDPEDKEPVPDGFWSYAQLPIGVQMLFSNIPAGVGSIMDLILPIIQFGQRCPDGYVQETPGGLCFPACKAGYKSDGAFLCYKQYPEFENNGLLHTITSITKKILTNTGTPPTECPGGDFDSGFCYPKCTPGYKGASFVCWADTEDVGAGTLPSKGPCDPGQRDDDTSCWEDYKGHGCYDLFGTPWCDFWGCGCIKKTLFDRQYCPGGDLIDGLCYKKCPAGKEHVPGMPYLCRTVGDVSYTRTAGTLPSCAAGKTEDSAGLCYDAAPPGYQKQSLGLISQVCPPGSADYGVGCTRESYSRDGKFPFLAEVRPTRKEVLEEDRLLKV